jgi:hypothetical protein
VRVLHWNIHSWRDAAGAPNHAAVERLISQTAPDAVSLVEVRESWGAPSQLAGLAERLGWPGAAPPGTAGPERRGRNRRLLPRPLAH